MDKEMEIFLQVFNLFSFYFVSIIIGGAILYNVLVLDCNSKMKSVTMATLLSFDCCINYIFS